MKYPLIITPKTTLLVLPATVGTICSRFSGNGLHLHDNAEMYYLMSGSAIHYIGDKTYFQKPGDCIFVPPFVPHTIDTSASEDTPILFTFYFNERIFSDFGISSFCLHRTYPQFEGMSLPLFRSFSSKEKEIADSLSRDALSEFSKKKNLSFEKLSHILTDFLRLLSVSPTEKKLTKTLFEQTICIMKTARYITEHYCEKITLSELCSVSTMSRSRFVEAFKHTTGMSSGRYLHILRLTCADHLLMFSKDTVDEIAKNTGLYNKSRLTSAFSEHFGITPAKYRKAMRPARLRADLETRNSRAMNDDIIEYFKNVQTYEESDK
ncbi:MAG: helix-turn-helix domain-containing protein [Ruminococcaceae bacterium]|nr:helix-turn-helix domain-containing protein [Oscillospiraceae bacterium]